MSAKAMDIGNYRKISITISVVMFIILYPRINVVNNMVGSPNKKHRQESNIKTSVSRYLYNFQRERMRLSLKLWCQHPLLSGDAGRIRYYINKNFFG